MAMVRTQIYLPADLDKKLREDAAARNISKAELIRQRLVDASRARQRFVDRLTVAQERLRDDTGWKFDRNELYDERADHILAHTGALQPVEPPSIRPPIDKAATQRILDRLRKVAEKVTDGPGTGWKFDRGEIYEHRIEKARPNRH